MVVFNAEAQRHRGDFRAGALPQTPNNVESQEISSHSGYGGMRRRSFAPKGRFGEAEPEGCASIREPHLQIISANSASLRLCVKILYVKNPLR